MRPRPVIRPSRLARALYWISGYLRCRLIRGNGDEPYLERYHLLSLPGGRRVYLHRFLASDPVRGLHDHPWRRSLGVVLCGGYDELRLHGSGDQARIERRRLVAGSSNRIAGTDFHRIVLNSDDETWTLFTHGGKCKDWGFLREAGNVDSYTPHEQVTREEPHRGWWRTALRGNKAGREALGYLPTTGGGSR